LNAFSHLTPTQTAVGGMEDMAASTY